MKKIILILGAFLFASSTFAGSEVREARKNYKKDNVEDRRKEVKESNDYKEAKDKAEDRRNEVKESDDYKEAKDKAEDRRKEINERR